MSVEQNRECSPHPEPNHVNTSLKSVKFAPLESTRISEVGLINDSDDQFDFHFRESSQKIQESVRICDLDDLVNDVPIIKKEISQPSLESRDNPFKPDGELCKEAEDILKRATIVRDTFILNDNSEKDTSKTSKDSSNGAQPILEESISQTKVNESQSSPVSIQPKQNGVEDKKVSPESVKQEVESNVVNDVNFKDKKKQKKCCSVM
ncbi:uncharacterized protein LOC133184431 isoform X4 [Saccostrea echinata]|uniref:uncharacterized protein LOC133184431 isoform X4 n=1 Tax=Saccostrea echinata TaxID=191078 RepID=UPI002A83A8BA|nr:uncharacterized protein LOC133184431 isoform X4 [Saccostrea echinata]